MGYVRRTDFWRNEAEADLPGLPLPIQVFALVVVLTMWARAASVSAGGSSG